MCRRSRLGTIVEKEESYEWDDHAWFGLGATWRHGPAPDERGPPAIPLCGTMARAGRAGLCPAAAGRRTHESRLGQRPWRLYHASVERRRVAELENYRFHARIACRGGKHARPILFSRWPPGRAG